MTSADLARWELERRERWRKAVLAHFEVTASNRDRVRRFEVASVVGATLGQRVIDNGFQKRVIALLLSMGAEAVNPRNKRYYRKLRRRGTKSASG